VKYSPAPPNVKATLAWVLVVIIAAFTALSFLSSRYWVHYDG